MLVPRHRGREKYNGSVFITDHDILTRVPFFFTRIVRFLGLRLLGLLGGPLLAIDKQILNLGEPLEKGGHIVDFSSGQDHRFP